MTLSSTQLAASFWSKPGITQRPSHIFCPSQVAGLSCSHRMPNITRVGLPESQRRRIHSPPYKPLHPWSELSYSESPYSESAASSTDQLGEGRGAACPPFMKVRGCSTPTVKSAVLTQSQWRLHISPSNKFPSGVQAAAVFTHLALGNGASCSLVSGHLGGGRVGN